MTIQKTKNYSKAEFYSLLRSGHFAEMVKESAKKGAVNSSKEVYNIFKPLTASEDDVEQFWVMFLDAKNNILEISLMFKGSINAATIYPREVIKKVIDKKSTAVVCCHNHPSGDPNPSAEDKQITFRLLAALGCIGVDLHDHIIIGDDGRYYSLADTEFIAKLRNNYNKFFGGSYGFID